jgi:beta-galactosidase
VQLPHVAKCLVSARAVVLHHDYSLAPDGTLTVSNIFTVDRRLPDLPRLGVRLVLPRGFEKLTWFGRGPHENYSDRKRSALIDRYESTVAAQYVPYILPQEHGNHTDARWVTLGNESRVELTVVGEGPLEFSASHFSAQDLYASFHTHELEARAHPETFLNLDYRQRGVGTASCGPDTLARYRIGPGTYRWAYSLIPGPISQSPLL